MNKYVRLFIWPFMLLLVATTLLSASFVFHNKEAPVAHAASSTTPSLSLASTTLKPFETVSASGQGLLPMTQ